MKMNRLAPCITLLMLCQATFAQGTVETDSFNMALRGQIDHFTNKNSCTGFENRSKIKSVMAIVENKGGIFEELTKFNFAYCGAELAGHKLNESQYFYKNIFGKSRHFTEFYSQEFDHLKHGGFAVIAHLDHMSKGCSKEVNELTLTLDQASGEKLSKTQTFTLPKTTNTPHFDAYFDEKGIHSKAIGNLKEDDIYVTYNFSFGNGEQHWQSLSEVVSREHGRDWKVKSLRELKGKSKGKLRYLSISYDYVGNQPKKEKYRPKLSDIKKTGGERRIELYDREHPFYSNMSPNGMCL